MSTRPCPRWTTSTGTSISWALSAAGLGERVYSAVLTDDDDDFIARIARNGRALHTHRSNATEEAVARFTAKLAELAGVS